MLNFNSLSREVENIAHRFRSEPEAQRDQLLEYRMNGLQMSGIFCAKENSRRAEQRNIQMDCNLPCQPIV